MAFLDITCPHCGQTCGNVGSGYVFRCPCGYVGDGGLSKEDVKAIEAFYQRHLERNREEDIHAN